MAGLEKVGQNSKCTTSTKITITKKCQYQINIPWFLLPTHERLLVIDTFEYLLLHGDYVTSWEPSMQFDYLVIFPCEHSFFTFNLHGP